MFHRRSVLIGLGAMVMGQLLSGCNSTNQGQLKIRLLKNSIPPQLLGEFRRYLDQPVKLNFKAQTQLKLLFTQLYNWSRQAQEGKSPDRPDLITLGDYWLELAIKEGLIEPLAVENLDEWENLPSRWQRLVQRNQQGKIADDGKVWGAPYRWGSTVIAYRRDKFESLGWSPTDWSDLWRPELRHHFSLLDQPREVIGLTLKKLGKSYNTENLREVSNLETELIALNQQVKFYSSNAYLQPLILGSTWLAVGWSTDIIPIQERYSNITAIIPKSGTALWSDLWVQPSTVNQNKKNNELVEEWIKFCWTSEYAQKIALLTDAASPLITNSPSQNLPETLSNNPLLVPQPEILEQSDFLEPLSPDTITQYEQMWNRMRNS